MIYYITSSDNDPDYTPEVWDNREQAIASLKEGIYNLGKYYDTVACYDFPTIGQYRIAAWSLISDPEEDDPDAIFYVTSVQLNTCYNE